MKLRWLSYAVVLSLLVGSCTTRPETAIPWPFSEEDFVLIELVQSEEGRVIEGNYPPGRRINGPTYHFDGATRTLESRQRQFRVSDSLKVVFGRSFSLRGAAGGGVSSQLFSVYHFPYQNGDFLLKGIDSNGRAHVQFHDTELIIESGSEWVNTVIRMDTVALQEYSAIAEFTYTTRVINHGPMYKAMIRTW